MNLLVSSSADWRVGILDSISFFVPVSPVPMSRPRFGKGGGIYYPARVKDFVHTVSHHAALAARVHHWSTLNENVFVALSFSKKNIGINCGDVDNLAKGVLDAMNGIIYDDDRHIINLFVSKRRVHRADEEGIFINVSNNLNSFFKHIDLFLAY